MKNSPQFDNWKTVFWFKMHLSPGVWDSKSDGKTQNFYGLNIRCVKHELAHDDEGKCNSPAPYVQSKYPC